MSCRMVTLMSTNGHTFTVDIDVARMSTTIRDLVEGR